MIDHPHAVRQFHHEVRAHRVRSPVGECASDFVFDIEDLRVLAGVGVLSVVPQLVVVEETPRLGSFLGVAVLREVLVQGFRSCTVARGEVFALYEARCVVRREELVNDGTDGEGHRGALGAPLFGVELGEVVLAPAAEHRLDGVPAEFRRTAEASDGGDSHVQRRSADDSSVLTHDFASPPLCSRSVPPRGSPSQVSGSRIRASSIRIRRALCTSLSNSVYRRSTGRSGV